jgi:hypothetical protein
MLKTEYRHHRLAMAMKTLLTQNEMATHKIGHTILADKQREDNIVIESVLEYIYTSARRDSRSQKRHKEGHRSPAN